MPHLVGVWTPSHSHRFSHLHDVLQAADLTPRPLFGLSAWDPARTTRTTQGFPQEPQPHLCQCATSPSYTCSCPTQPCTTGSKHKCGTPGKAIRDPHFILCPPLPSTPAHSLIPSNNELCQMPISACTASPCLYRAAPPLAFRQHLVSIPSGSVQT